MRLRCTNKKCKSAKISKDGTYHRPSDGQRVQRWKCKVCKTRFSSATLHKAYGHNKRKANFQVLKLLCSGVSMRRTAKLLNLHRITVARKLEFLSKTVGNNPSKVVQDVQSVQFDDLITTEHTKCKPLAISMAVENDTRHILGFEVAIIPASGYLASISRRKYGFRENEKAHGWHNLFTRLKGCVSPKATFCSDEDVLYPQLVRKHFTKATHSCFKGSKGSLTGQGELKKVAYDPLFSINHSFAMLRANINRLFRRTWCTTKKSARLKQHLSIYIYYHNTYLI